MSITLINEIYDNRPLDPGAPLSVLLALATFADEESRDRTICPAVRTLMQMTGYKQAAVYKALGVLAERNIIQDAPRADWPERIRRMNLPTTVRQILPVEQWNSTPGGNSTPVEDSAPVDRILHPSGPNQGVNQGVSALQSPTDSSEHARTRERSATRENPARQRKRSAARDHDVDQGKVDQAVAVGVKDPAPESKKKPVRRQPQRKTQGKTYGPESKRLTNEIMALAETRDYDLGLDEHRLLGIIQAQLNKGWDLSTLSEEIRSFTLGDFTGEDPHTNLLNRLQKAARQEPVQATPIRSVEPEPSSDDEVEAQLQEALKRYSAKKASMTTGQGVPA